MKKCGGCQQVLELTEFNKNKAKKDGLNCSCKECSKRHSREHYLRNRDRIIKDSKITSANSKKRNKDFLESLNLSCLLCPENYFPCLDFHHIDPKDKWKEVSDLMPKYKLDVLKKELAKCVCVCSNCHRKIHAGLIVLTEEQKSMKAYIETYPPKVCL